MRTQATVVPTFWTRGSGKKLRGFPDAQVLALYFMTGPQSTKEGIYYASLATILHDTGLTEAAFREALPRVDEIALYDEQEGLVYLPEGAAYQMGETLSIKDSKRKSILAQLEVYGNHRFVKLWVERYYAAYNFNHEGITKPFVSPLDAPSTPPRPPLDAPSTPLSEVPHAPDPRSRSDPRSNPRSENRESGAEAPIVAPLQLRAQAWVKDPFAASMSYPDPHLWTEALELSQLVATTFSVEADALCGPTANGSLDGRVAALLGRWAEGVDQARMRLAVRGAKHSDLIAGRPDLQSLQTIFKDGNAVDKYCRLARGKEPAVKDQSNKKKLTAEAIEKDRKFKAGEF